MIRYVQGDVVGADAEALVNTVNCVGVMGRGVALQFKHAFPANYRAYAAACRHGEVHPGRVFVFEMGELASPRYIINFPTKRHWKGKSRIEDIRSGLVSLVNELKERGIQSVAVPPLGTGLGGLDWNEVRPLIEAALSELSETDVIVYEPGYPLAESRTDRSTNVPSMTAGRAALVGLLNRYLAALMDPAVTLLEAHKLMYFLQEAQQPLRLRYVKGPYGPYAENLRHVFSAVEGHLIAGYAARGDKPDQQLALLPGAVDDAEAFLREDAETRGRFEHVARLVEGFETPFGLELLATVHWVMAKEGFRDLDSIVTAVYGWAPRKAQFTRSQIELAVERLMTEGWLEADSANSPA